MNWKKVESREDLPKKRPFISLWKGLICITEYDDEQDKFWIMFSPYVYERPWIIPHDRESKFSHYVPLDYPEAYPLDY